MKKIIKIVSLVLVLCWVVFFSVRYFKKAMLVFNPKIAYIYVDSCSFPTLLQMVDFVQRDFNSPKFVSWERIVNLDEKNDLFKNTFVSKRSPTDNYPTVLEQRLKAFVSSHSDYQFSVHVNMEHDQLVMKVLKAVPEERIKEIHFYEDSFGHDIWKMQFPDVSKLDGKKLLPQSSNAQTLSYAVMHKYSSVLHVSLPEIAQENKYLRDAMSSAKKIEKIDLIAIAKKLTSQQKQKLLTLAGITDNDLLPFRSGKKVLLYCMGYFMDNERMNELQIEVLNTAISNFKNSDEYIWVYKEHPWLTIDTSIRKKLEEKYPNLKRIPKGIPLEVLFLAGYMPDKIFGYSSSIFFSTPKENIWFYIKREPVDEYLPLLRRLDKLSNQQIVSFSNYSTQEAIKKI